MGLIPQSPPPPYWRPTGAADVRLAKALDAAHEWSYSARDRREIEFLNECADHPELFENPDGTPNDKRWDAYMKDRGCFPAGYADKQYQARYRAAKRKGF